MSSLEQSRPRYLDRLRSIGLLLGSLALISCSRSTTKAPASAAKLEVAPNPSGHELLDQDALNAPELTQPGAGQRQVIAVEPAATGDRVTGTFLVPEASCVLLMARGGPSVQDLDLFAYGDDGTSFGEDERPIKQADLLVCPPHPKRIFVVARVASGHGLVAVGGQLVPEQAASALRQALEGKNGSTRETEPSNRFEVEFSERRLELGSHWKTAQQSILPVESANPTIHNITAEPKRCLDILAVPGAGVSHLDMALLDAQGRVLGRATSAATNRTLQVCTPHSAEFSLELRPHLGVGVVGLLVSEASEGTAELEESVRYRAGAIGSLDRELQNTLAEKKRLGLPLGKTLSRAATHIGQLDSVPLELDTGCHFLDIVLGKPARGVRAWLWNQAGQLVSSASGDAAATLITCTSAGKYRLDIEGELSPGPFGLLLATDTKVAPPFLEEPLAAGRMLSLLGSRGVLRGNKQLAGIERYTLTDTSYRSKTLDVQPGRCLELVLAAGERLSGLELSVRSSSGEPLELGRGPQTVAVRQCNLEGRGPLRISVEMRTEGGTGTALLGWQMLSPSP